MYAKINVIAKNTCYLERSVVTLKLHKEYLNTVTYNTTVLLEVHNGLSEPKIALHSSTNKSCVNSTRNKNKNN